MIVVANASPLIGLSAVNSLGLLNSLFGAIHISEAVYREIVISGRGRVGSAEVASAAWIQRHEISDTAAVSRLMTAAKLNTGESETLILATEITADLVIIDERPARRHAFAQKLPVTGTIGVLMLAKTRGLVSEIKPLLDALTGFGMRLDHDLYRYALRRAGE